mgnify:FL=1
MKGIQRMPLGITVILAGTTDSPAGAAESVES